MLACDWFKNCQDNAAKVKLQNFSQNHRQKLSFCSVISIVGKSLLQCDSSLQATYLDTYRPKCEFLFCDACTVLRYPLCSSFNLEKKLIAMLFYHFVDPHPLNKIYVEALRVCFVSLGNFGL